jgi:hypothetical protein
MQGLQLTDKEFRYLWTVRVTAAVYCVLDLWLSPQNLSQQHWADVSPNTSSFDFAETCVFGKQSLLPAFFLFLFPKRKNPFSRSYWVNWPSSFSMILSIALVYSTTPPVSVSGTALFLLKIFPERTPRRIISIITHSPTWHSLTFLSFPIRVNFGVLVRFRFTSGG